MEHMRHVRSALIKNSMRNIRIELKRLENMLISIDKPDPCCCGDLDCEIIPDDETFNINPKKSSSIDTLGAKITSRISTLEEKIAEIQDKVFNNNPEELNPSCHPFWFDCQNAKNEIIITGDTVVGNDCSSIKEQPPCIAGPIVHDEVDVPETIVHDEVDVPETIVEKEASDVEIELEEFIYGGKTYYKDNDGDVYRIDNDDNIVPYPEWKNYSA